MLFIWMSWAFAFFTSSVRAEPVPAKDRTVVLISIDGFPAWMWRDDTTPIPTLRRLAREGAVAEAMTVSNPSITWINHTTMVTGVEPLKHGVLYNGLLVRNGPTSPPVVEQWRDKSELVHVPTLYDVAHAAGLKTAQADWVAVQNSGTIDAEMLEVPKRGGEIERELVQKGILTDDQLAGFTKNKNVAWRDMVWTQSVVHMIETRQPNLILLHTLNTDSINHRYGPGTFASYTAYAYADRLVADVIQALEKSGRPATVFITTDHGFKKVEKIVLPNIVLAKAGLLQADGPKPVTCQAYVVPQGGLAFVFVTDPAQRAKIKPKLRDLFANQEGVAQVLDGSEAPTLGMPTPEENQGMGDLILYAKPGYAFQGAVLGEEPVIVSETYLGTHGYQASDPELEGIFLACGYGIKSGTQLPKISNLNIAPTIATLLGLTMPPMDGKPLLEILDPKLLPSSPTPKPEPDQAPE